MSRCGIPSLSRTNRFDVAVGLVRPGESPSVRRERAGEKSVRSGSCAMSLASSEPSRAPMPSSCPCRGFPRPVPVEGFTADLPGVFDVKDRPKGRTLGRSPDASGFHRPQHLTVLGAMVFGIRCDVPSEFSERSCCPATDLLSWGSPDCWPWRGSATCVSLLITSGSSLRVPGRSPHPPRPCRSPGGPSRAPTVAVFDFTAPCGVVSSSPSASGHRSPSEHSLLRPGRKPTSSLGIRPDRHCPGHRCPTRIVRPHRPFIDMLQGVHSQHDVATAPSAPGQPDQESRSDLVVSHHLAGFLRP